MKENWPYLGEGFAVSIQGSKLFPVLESHQVLIGTIGKYMSHWGSLVMLLLEKKYAPLDIIKVHYKLFFSRNSCIFSKVTS